MIGGIYREREDALLPVESQLWNLRRGLEWVVRNRKRYDIRIVNVSCGGDYLASYLRDGLSQAAERATRDGILVCAAVGNQVLPTRAEPREDMLQVGCRRRDGPERRGIEWAAGCREQQRARGAARDLETPARDVLVRDAIAGKVQQRTK